MESARHDHFLRIHIISPDWQQLQPVMRERMNKSSCGGWPVPAAHVPREQGG
jgi:hypothetical protein